MKTKKILSALLILALAVLTVFVPAVKGASGDGLPVYDRTNPASPVSPKVMSASELLRLITDDEIRDAEARYIDRLLGEALSYSDYIPTGRVKVHYDGEKVYVVASEYEYTAADGTRVKWTPCFVSLMGEKYALEYSEGEESYVLETGLDLPENYEGEIYADVEYRFEFSISGSDAELYRNCAYRRALEIKAETEEYELDLEAYNSYTEYTAAKKKYDTEILKYNKYIEEKAIYDNAKRQYDKYLAEYAAYLEKLAAYEAYVESVESYDERLAAYNEYRDAVERYNEQKRKYDEYNATMAKALQKLTVIENMFVANSKGQVMYNTLHGPTVQQVLDNRQLLVDFGKADPNDILAAGAATDKLKTLLQGYKNQTTFENKYGYYVENYDAIKENFIILYESLRQLYENEAVYAGIVYENRLERYVEFVSHLYVLQSCLNDGYILKENWIIKREYSEKDKDFKYYSYTDVLEECQIPVDTNNYAPYDLAALPERVEAPVMPEYVAPPTVLPAVSEPQAPDEVDEPIPPVEVSEPVKPIEVAPAEKPIEPQYSLEEKGILNELERGRLTERQSNETVSLSFTSICSKVIPKDGRYIVTFYDDDGRTVLYQYYGSYLDRVEYKGEEPEKANDGRYTYTFSGWKNEEGEDAEFGEITEYETVFYASYAYETNKYKVTWVVNGEETHEYYEYGQIPTFGGSTDKNADARYTYRFVGWHEVPTAVTGDAIYIANYERKDRLYTVTFDIDGKLYTEQYKYGEIPLPDYDTEKPEDETFIYTFEGWDKELSAVKGDATYTAVYSKENIAENENGESISVEVVESDGTKKYKVEAEGGEIRADRVATLVSMNQSTAEVSLLSGECSIIFTPKNSNAFVSAGGVYITADKDEEKGEYRIGFSNEYDVPIVLGTQVSVLIKYSGADEYTKVYTRDAEGNMTQLAASFSDDGITVKLYTGAILEIRKEYPVRVDGFTGGVVTPDKQSASSGETVKFNILLEGDYEIKEIKAVGAHTNNSYTIDEDGCLVMPDEPVTVMIISQERTYTVTFISDGKIVSEHRYKRGDKIVKPTDPTKPSTEEKLFSFVEWSPIFHDGMTVTGDATYTAVFREILVEDQKGFIPEEDNRFITFILTLLAGFVLTVIGITVLIVVLVKRRKKKKLLKAKK